MSSHCVLLPMFLCLYCGWTLVDSVFLVLLLSLLWTVCSGTSVLVLNPVCLPGCLPYLVVCCQDHLFEFEQMSKCSPVLFTLCSKAGIIEFCTGTIQTKCLTLCQERDRPPALQACFIDSVACELLNIMLDCPQYSNLSK